MRNRKLLHQIKNKWAWLPIMLLAACQSNTAYHSYQSIPLTGWAKSDTIVYVLPASIPAGEYEVEIGIRYQECYPYRDIWLGISQNMQDTLVYTTDTLQLFLADEEGNKIGNGPGGLYQCSLPYRAAFKIKQEGNARSFRIVQIMKDDALKGISDIGIQIQKPER
ncbi:MAG: gliding motility lipoprotein GldH [Bacteroides sp.]|nr:gliding motility lipoprotein GldH [Bacteroides sp.]